MAVAAQILGNNVFDHEGNSIDVATHFAGKTLGIYFSAHWCPPCRQFTPILSQFYNTYHTAKNFEIVFVSGDEDAGSFAAYFTEMPWLTVSFDDKEKIEELNVNYEVEGIPTLVLVNADSGELLQKDARTPIQFEDQEGQLYPWAGMTFD